MKKNLSKSTVVMVLVAFLTLSVGYALFSDIITIEGTATAQGSFDIETTCYTEIPDTILAAYSNAYGPLGNVDVGYSDASCIVSDDKNEVTFSVSLDYPGASKWFLVKLSNVGTIDARIHAENFENLSLTELKTYDSNTKELIKTEKIGKDFINGGYGILNQNTDGSYTENEEDLIDYDTESYVLNVGNNWYLFYETEWSENDKYSQNGVYYVASHTIELPFVQYTK